MANNTDKQLIELIENFFLKATLLICHSKSQSDSISSDSLPKNRWFNINTLQDPVLEAEIKEWTMYDGKKTLPPLVIETYLDLRKLTSTQSITLKDQEGNPWNVCKGTRKSEIVLERWLVELDKPLIQSNFDEDVSDIYKQLILLFRYLYTLIQLLPASDLQMRLSKTKGPQDSSPLPIKINTRILDGSKAILSKGRVGLSKNIIATYSNIINETNIASHLEQRKITPIHTKFGSLRISVSYRRDCDFHVNDNEEYYANQFVGPDAAHSKTNVTPAISSLRRVSINSNRSLSISPNTATSPGFLADPSPQRRSLTASRQLQPFRVGSVGSGSASQVQPSSTLTRNPSGSSVVATLRAQRSSNGSITVPTNVAPEPHIEPSSIGSGSASKYSSSFGRIRRHSSIRRSESLERPLKPTKSNETPSEDLLDFMRLLDDKQELRVKKLQGPNTDISSSLIKFQSMRSNNDTLSDDLSMSLSMEPRPGGAQQRYRSDSHSPIPSFSPSMHYSSIPMRLSQSRSNSARADSFCGLASRRNSIDKTKSMVSSRTGSFLEQHNALNSNNIVEDEDDNALLVDRSEIGSVAANKIRSASPRSIQSVSSSFSKSQLPFKSLANFSQPTTMATPAYAKLHKARVGSGSPPEHHEESDPKKEDSTNADDDDDLLFFMSDMNLSK